MNTPQFARSFFLRTYVAFAGWRRFWLLYVFLHACVFAVNLEFADFLAGEDGVARGERQLWLTNQSRPSTGCECANVPCGSSRAAWPPSAKRRSASAPI